MPRVISLILWYLAAHTIAPTLTVNYITAENLKKILGSLGMRWVDRAEMDMTGDTWTIAQEARAAAEREQWTLRDPRTHIIEAFAQGGPLRHSLPFGGQETPSGYYFPSGPSVTTRTQASELDAARSLLRLDGATVLHVHGSNGTFAVDGRELTPGQFHDEILTRLPLPPGQPLILMGCQTATAAPEVAVLTGELVFGATKDAFTTTTQQILTTSTGYDPKGRPVPDLASPGQWQPAWPDGRSATPLGSDLITGLRNNPHTTHLNITPTHGPLPAPPPDHHQMGPPQPAVGRRSRAWS